MSTPTPTPRPALKATGMRRRHARCLETELAALTTERDRLRAELEKVYVLVTPVGFDLPGGIFETAQAVTELRAEVGRLGHLEAVLRSCAFDKDGTAWKTVCGWWSKKYDAAERQMSENATRAERAEAELAAERARLDSGQIMLIVAGERVWHSGVDLRAAIDAGMREGAK